MGALPEAALDRLEFTLWEAPRLGAGLEEDIRDWITSTPDARLIIIDILEGAPTTAPQRQRLCRGLCGHE